jgi:DNA-directed RNA polymerase subunit RPC12/RpoP
MSTVRKEWNMACPDCGADDRLIVTFQSEALLTPNGTDDDEGSGDHEWDDQSPIRCDECGWGGKVEDTEVKDGL